MKYWLLDQDYEGLQVYSDIEIIYSEKKIYADATSKESDVIGTLNDDFPLIIGIPGLSFSKRIIDAILKLNPEGIEIRPILLTLPDNQLKNDWHEISISAHVDCIDFKSSTLKMDEDGSIRRIKKLVLNEEKADRAGYDIFRLHDEFPRIVISDRIKQAIESVNPTGICFEPTDGSDPDWY